MSAIESVFGKYHRQNYPFVFEVQLHMERIAGGTPTDPKVAEGWLKTKIAGKDDLIREAVAEIMVERGVTADEAADMLVKTSHLNGFKRDESGLYIEGRQVKACIKESSNIKWPDKRWGPTKKGTKSYIPEHIFVVDDRIPLGVVEPSRVDQRFVHTRFGAAIEYCEVVEDSKLSFTVETDLDWPEKTWAELWTCAEMQGLGATRSQGYGRFSVVGWTKIK